MVVSSLKFTICGYLFDVYLSINNAISAGSFYVSRYCLNFGVIWLSQPVVSFFRSSLKFQRNLERQWENLLLYLSFFCKIFSL